MLVTKPIDLPLLQKELNAASVTVNGLGLVGVSAEPFSQDVHTYTPAGTPTELPAGAVPVVNAHVAPPRVVEYAEQTGVSSIVRTINGGAVEIYRFSCLVKHIYRANLRLSGVDAGNGNCRIIEARFVWKRPAGTPIIVGTTTVSTIQDTGASSWTQALSVSGTDVVFTVTGAGGRTIDWLLTGEVGVFAPEGL